MGPFSVDRQRQRKQTLERLAATPDLAPEVARIWLRLADEVTFDEEEYNQRIVNTYRDMSSDRFF